MIHDPCLYKHLLNLSSSFESLPRNHDIWSECLQPLTTSKEIMLLYLMNHNLLMPGASNISTCPPSPFSDFDSNLQPLQDEDCIDTSTPAPVLIQIQISSSLVPDLTSR